MKYLKDNDHSNNQWRRVKLGNICQVVTGGTPPKSNPKYYGGTIPWIKPDDLDKGMYVSESREYLTEEGAKVARLLPAGAILVSCIGNLGKRAIAAKTLATNQQINALIPSEELDSEFLFFACATIQAQLHQIAATTIIPIVNKSAFSELQIPIPPIDEQCRIATRLKVQMAEIEKARLALEQELCETGNLADAIILDSIRKSETQSYSLGDVLEEVKNGIGKDWSDYPVWGATREGLAPAKEPPGKKPERYKPAFPGTVFYNPMRILIGSIAFVDTNEKPGITSPDYVALTGKNGIVDSRWFYFWLRSPLGKQCITSLARGAVRERMLFNRLIEGKIDLPDYKLQQTASKALAELKHLRKAIDIKMNEINLLPAKILSQVFEM